MPELKLPNVIIAGAPKSGSSSLYYWLMAHPEVCGAKIKETHFFNDEVLPRFNGNANAHEHGLEAYARHFEHCDSTAKVIAEATPIYLYHDTPVRELSKWESKPKFVFILREPSQRAYSQFRFNKYRLGNIEMGLSYPDYLKETKGTVSDPIQRGRFLPYLAKYTKAFGKENVFVLQSEALYANKAQEMKRLADFLGIDGGFYENFDYFKRNETKKMRSTKLHRFGLKLQPLVPIWLQEKVMIPLYLRFNSTSMPPASKGDKALVAEMQKDFNEDNEALAKEFSHVNLSLWK